MILYSVDCIRRASDGKEIESISSINPPNTVPSPLPVVTVCLAVRSSILSMPLRVTTAAASTSQSTCTERISSIFLMKRWLRRYPSVRASGAPPSVINVTSSRLST
ncbi:hypothetical protein D3C81_1786300 [compost metagenome]